jgi:hypothetical protein
MNGILGSEGFVSELEFVWKKKTHVRLVESDKVWMIHIINPQYANIEGCYGLTFDEIGEKAIKLWLHKL